MLIRSHDKTCLTNMAQVTDIFYSESRKGTTQNITAVLSSAETTHLGTYSTEEKAIKVLDMIQNAYVNYQYSKWVGYERETVIDCIFEMPQDEEVN